MHKREGRREVAALRQGEGDPRGRQHVATQVAIDREQRAGGGKGGPATSHHDSSYVGERSLAVRWVGQHSDHDPLNQSVNDGASHQCSE